VEHILVPCFHAELQAAVTNGRTSEFMGEKMSEQNDFSGLAFPTTRRRMMTGGAALFGAFRLGALRGKLEDGAGITHSADAIHMEPVFSAGRKRVYEALTDAGQFDKFMHMSVAMQSMAPGGKPAEISPEVGGAFLLFGGYVTGRNIELVPEQRIVQAWRSEGWKPHEYSIAKFELVEQVGETKIVFDHRGFPDGNAEHLLAGWKENYWEPLEKYLRMQKQAGGAPI
jgi:uncharacterized protein YndB with AHSA1/START domain